jgi:S1-C subfamily serine protease
MPRIAKPAAAALLLVPLALAPLGAQVRDSSRVVRPAPGAIASTMAGSANRAVLGVTLAAAGLGDTAGVRIDEVDPNGPASKAGITAGSVLTAINGVSLRVSADDAADPQLGGLGQRRLQRTLANAAPGDEVTLRVRDGSQERTVTVKTVSAADLSGRAARGVGTLRGAAEEAATRSALGLAIGATGTARDTLGLFVSSVTRDGPAEKAGIIEGDRIASINGVDVRVPREDIDDMPSGMARANRFTRELRKLTPGDKATLRVWGGGRWREVTVATVKASELPSRGGFQFWSRDGQVYIGGSVDVAPMMEEFRLNLDRMRRELQVEADSIRVRVAPRVRMLIGDPPVPPVPPVPPAAPGRRIVTTVL